MNTRFYFQNSGRMKCSATSREILETSSGKNERKKKEMTENKRNEEESSLVERNLSAMTERNQDRKKKKTWLEV